MGYTPKLLRLDLRSGRLSEQSAFPEETALVFSSRPYPLDVSDEVSAALSLVAGKLYTGLLSTDEELDASLTLVSAQLRDIVQAYGSPVEMLDAALTLSGGQLRDQVQTYDRPVDSLDAALILSDGSMRQLLLSYANWPAESLDASLTLASGSLV